MYKISWQVHFLLTCQYFAHLIIHLCQDLYTYQSLLIKFLWYGKLHTFHLYHYQGLIFLLIFLLLLVDWIFRWKIKPLSTLEHALSFVLNINTMRIFAILITARPGGLLLNLFDSISFLIFLQFLKIMSYRLILMTFRKTSPFYFMPIILINQIDILYSVHILKLFKESKLLLENSQVLIKNLFIFQQ